MQTDNQVKPDARTECDSTGSSPARGYASTWWKRYRIVRDKYAGYEVQCWRIWLPIWLQCGLTNTHSTIERARKYAAAHSRRESWEA